MLKVKIKQMKYYHEIEIKNDYSSLVTDFDDIRDLNSYENKDFVVIKWEELTTRFYFNGKIERYWNESLTSMMYVEEEHIKIILVLIKLFARFRHVRERKDEIVLEFA
ncbi:MAG: hypothetical protein ACTSQY_00815 [Candidatus Odinarchaeia archaeon]